MSIANTNIGKVVLKNTSYVYIRSFVSQLINIIVIVGIIRKLSIEQFGVYNFLFGLSGILQVFATGGILVLLQRFVPEYISINKNGYTKQLIKGSFSVTIPLLTLIIGTIFIFSNPIGNVFNILNLKQYLSIFSFYVFLFLINGLCECVLASSLFQKQISINFIIYSVIRGCLFLKILHFSSISLMQILWAELLSYGIYFVLNLFTLFKFYLTKLSKGKEVIDSMERNRLLRYFLLGSFNEAGAQVLSVETDYYIISACISPYYLGLYSFANRIKEMILNTLPIRKGYEVIRPIFFDKLSKSSNFNLNLVFNFLLKISTFTTVPLLIIIGTLGNEIIYYVFGAKYLQSYHVLLIFLFFIFASSFQSIIGLVCQLKEEMGLVLVSKIFAIYNLVMALIVIRKFGIEGVAFATLSATVLQVAFVYYFIAKKYSLKIEKKAIIKIIFNCLVTGIIVFLAKAIIKSIFLLVLVFAGGLFLFILLSFFNKSFKESESKFINQIFNKQIWVF